MQASKMTCSLASRSKCAEADSSISELLSRDIPQERARPAAAGPGLNAWPECRRQSRVQPDLPPPRAPHRPLGAAPRARLRLCAPLAGLQQAAALRTSLLPRPMRWTKAGSAGHMSRDASSRTLFCPLEAAQLAHLRLCTTLAGLQQPGASISHHCHQTGLLTLSAQSAQACDLHCPSVMHPLATTRQNDRCSRTLIPRAVHCTQPCPSSVTEPDTLLAAKNPPARRAST